MLQDRADVSLRRGFSISPFPLPHTLEDAFQHGTSRPSSLKKVTGTNENDK